MRYDSLTFAAKKLQLLNSDKWDTVYFHGKTMRPFLQEGDELIIIPIDVKDISPGDIVAYSHKDKFPTRRVIRIFYPRKLFLIQGDNIPQKKFLVSFDHILGIATTRIRNTKTVNTDDIVWKLTSFWVLKRERIKYKLKEYPKKGLWGTIRRFLP